MSDRPTSRLADDVLFTRAAITYHDFGSPDHPDVQAVVSYVEPQRSGMHVIRLIGCRMQIADDRIMIGGAERCTFFKNAGIGRRACPACWDPHDPARVKERGPSAGVCPRCNRKVDPILSSLRPYFYYFHGDDGGKALSVVGGSALMTLADELKTALLTIPETDVMRLPILDGGAIKCELDSVTTFPRRKREGLRGSDKIATYDFWSHPMRQLQHVKTRRRR